MVQRSEKYQKASKKAKTVKWYIEDSSNKMLAKSRKKNYNKKRLAKSRKK